MYKRIICPTDFSNAANNAVEYAANLAKELDARLHLLNVKSLISSGSVPAGVWVGPDAEIASDLLKKTHDVTLETFGVDCTYEVDVTRKAIDKEISEAGGADDLMVMGTDGADSLFEYFFGTHTYHVIKNAKCPVLVVPEHKPYEKIEKIVAAWDYSRRNELSLSEIKLFLDTTGASITLVHISKKDTDISNDVYNAFKERAVQALGADPNRVSFDRIVSPDITNSLSTYMNQSGANLLVLTQYEHDWATNLFRQSVVKNMTTIAAAYPTLIMHV
ncbi:MAG: putative universal stress protein UspA [Bacteroidetes bacterium]|nr:MAG: putative universal stress protein UspA [Bacteroidota bacterium]